VLRLDVGGEPNLYEFLGKLQARGRRGKFTTSAHFGFGGRSKKTTGSSLVVGSLLVVSWFNESRDCSERAFRSLL
jgi:hypothetical protein